MNATSYEAEALRIIALVKTEFVSADGSLFLERTGAKILERHIFPDLGDMIPFFMYFGENDFIAQQIELYSAARKGPYLVSQFPSLGMHGLVKSYEYTDLILGLAVWWEAAPTDSARRKVLEDTVHAADRAFRFATVLRSLYLPRFHIRLPLIDTRDATLIECFTTLYRSTNDGTYLERARAIYTTLTSTTFFKNHGLFPDYIPTSWIARQLLRKQPKTNQSTICKSDSNALFALLDLYRTERDEQVLTSLRTLLNAVLTKARSKEGAITEHYVPGERVGAAYLTASFPILDFLCDLAQEIPSMRDYALAEARIIADYWITQQGPTGLFPLHPGKPETFFDSETDMTIALYKLAECTDDIRYRDSANRCLEGLLTYHGQRDYPLGVNITTGAVTNATQRTKFLCLFLKLLILKIEQAKGQTIYGNPYLFELLKDR